MKKIIKTILNHKWAVLCAILIGLIIVAPQAFFRIRHNDIYKNIGLGGGDESAYLNRIQEVRDGHYSTANYVWLEGKGLPYLDPSLSEIIANFAGQVFGLNIADTATFGRFFFPACVFILIYILIYQLVKKKSVALVISATVLLSTELVNPRVIFNLIFKQLPASYDFLPFNRLIAPPVHLIFFFGFLLLFWLFIENKKPAYKYLSGIVLGLSFYTYPYTWTFLFAFLGCLGIINIFRKKWIAIKNIIIIAIIALAISTPYLINLWQVTHHPLYTTMSLRFGLINTHMPQISSLMLIFLSIFLLFFNCEQVERYCFCLALVFAPLIVLNQQIITGRILIPDHYHWYYHKPLVIIFVLIIIFEFIDKKITVAKLKKISWVSLISVIMIVNFYNAWMVQFSSYKNGEPLAIELNERYGLIVEWLNNNTYKDEVVAGSNIITYLVPMYTSLNSVSAENGHYTLTADEEQMAERIFLKMRLNGLKEGNIEEVFIRDRANISSAIYGQQYRKQNGAYGNIPDEKLYWMINKYEQFLRVPIEDMLQKYQVKYIIWDTVNDVDGQINQYLFLKEVYQANGIKIYNYENK